MNPQAPQYNNLKYKIQEFHEDFGLQYKYFHEIIDPEFPEPLITGLDITFFSDSDHAHDKVTGRSITGMIGMVGSTPVRSAEAFLEATGDLESGDSVPLRVIRRGTPLFIGLRLDD